MARHLRSQLAERGIDFCHGVVRRWWNRFGPLFAGDIKRKRISRMKRFRRIESLQKFASVHASIHNHFSRDRHLVDRQTCKLRRSAALVKWQNLMA